MLKTNYSVCQTKLQLCRGSALVSAGLYSFTFTKVTKTRVTISKHSFRISKHSFTISKYSFTISKHFSQFQNTLSPSPNGRVTKCDQDQTDNLETSPIKWVASKQENISDNSCCLYSQSNSNFGTTRSTPDTKLCLYYVLRTSDRLSIRSYCVHK